MTLHVTNPLVRLNNRGDAMKFTPRTLAALVLLPFALVACSDDPSGPDPLTVPAGLTAQATGTTSIRVTWTAVAGATSYTVERAQGTAGGFVSAGTATTTTFDDSGLQPSTTYRYRIA